MLSKGRHRSTFYLIVSVTSAYKCEVSTCVKFNKGAYLPQYITTSNIHLIFASCDLVERESDLVPASVVTNSCYHSYCVALGQYLNH